jgi:hypothetical protein
MQLQNGIPDFPSRTPWWALIRNALMTAISSRWLERHDSSYRPERHYMRGPGPKWRAKYGGSAH